MRYRHYTLYQRLRDILKTGVILPATVGINEGESPVVWFSTNPDWEETVRKRIVIGKKGQQIGPLSKDGLSKYGFPPVRIEVNPAKVSLYSWEHFKEHSGIPVKQAKELVKVAKKWGANHQEWWVCYEPVPLTSCLNPIEIWNGSEWIDIEDALKSAA
jgi:hypothetical protein